MFSLTRRCHCHFPDDFWPPEQSLYAQSNVGDRVAISDLTRLECRVGALKRRDAKILTTFDSFFVRPDIVILPLTAQVFDQATQLRADFGFKTPDAVHLAAAIEGACHCFLTNDARLSRRTGIAFEVLP
jgi:predicted nucleic acid-binding protein